MNTRHVHTHVSPTDPIGVRLHQLTGAALLTFTCRWTDSWDVDETSLQLCSPDGTRTSIPDLHSDPAVTVPIAQLDDVTHDELTDALTDARADALTDVQEGADGAAATIRRLDDVDARLACAPTVDQVRAWLTGIADRSGYQLGALTLPDADPVAHDDVTDLIADLVTAASADAADTSTGGPATSSTTAARMVAAGDVPPDQVDVTQLTATGRRSLIVALTQLTGRSRRHVANTIDHHADTMPDRLGPGVTDAALAWMWAATTSNPDTRGEALLDTQAWFAALRTHTGRTLPDTRPGSRPDAILSAADRGVAGTDILCATCWPDELDTIADIHDVNVDDPDDVDALSNHIQIGGLHDPAAVPPELTCTRCDQPI